MKPQKSGDEQEIVLKFDLNTGETHIEAHGFKGPGCLKATGFLKGTLGETTDFKRKSEWYESNLAISGKINSNWCG